MSTPSLFLQTFGDVAARFEAAQPSQPSDNPAPVTPAAAVETTNASERFMENLTRGKENAQKKRAQEEEEEDVVKTGDPFEAMKIQQRKIDGDKLAGELSSYRRIGLAWIPRVHSKLPCSNWYTYGVVYKSSQSKQAVKGRFDCEF
jgi:hypothetical protein